MIEFGETSKFEVANKRKIDSFLQCTTNAGYIIQYGYFIGQTEPYSWWGGGKKAPLPVFPLKLESRPPLKTSGFSGQPL